MDYTKKTFELLKDFQKDTVEFAYEKLQKNSKFLVADEVGLGKTMIAKGVIAKTIDKLQKQNKDKLEIVYITTNQSIAYQNIQTLKVGENNSNSKRLSLLVTTLNNESKINFRSFTVGTSLEFKGVSTGTKEEREFIVFLLKEIGCKIDSRVLKSYFHQNAGKSGFEINHQRLKDRYENVSQEFIESFKTSLKAMIPDIEQKIINKEESVEKIKELRKLLVLENLKYLDADLIILDEFQRFSKLLTSDKEDKEENEIIKVLFESNHKTKTLLLSATPYKLLDCGDTNEHYDEFYTLIKWLLNSKNDRSINQLKGLFDSLYKGEDVSNEIENFLHKVMCRTERISFSNDSMIENLDVKIAVSKKYLNEYKKYYNLNLQGTKRYIKSAPSALNYMKPYLKSPNAKDGYKFKKSFLENRVLLHKDFKKEVKSHPKLDALHKKSKKLFLKEMIWMPPLSPTIKSKQNKLSTKILIFSKWDFVPDSIVGSFHKKNRPTNYTDKKSFIDRDRLLELDTDVKNPYDYRGIKSKNELLREINKHIIDAKLILASPAYVIYRAIKKYTNGIYDKDIKDIVTSDPDDKKSLANIFIKFLGKDENYSKIKSFAKDSSNKLEMILDYSIEHNIQAMFDEYIHILCDSPKFKSKDSQGKLQEIYKAFSTVFTLRPNEVTYDSFDDKNIIKSTKIAMRISKSSMKAHNTTEIDEDEKPLTADNVKDAFNSPFAPFILATTSIGQEGLDFHPYCHQIWHWEIPSNPVDLEQREGRIHRYKNYAVRKNVAKESESNCWIEMFEDAAKQVDYDDFKTYWLFAPKEQHQRIQRVVQTLPFTKDAQRYEKLKKHLEIYRTVIGQKQQKDKMDEERKITRISLKPIKYKDANEPK